MPFFLPILAFISAAATGVGTYMSYQGQRAAADQADKTAKYNAQIQRNQAMQEGAAAAENARRKARENARLLGRQRSMIAQSGVAMEGTPLARLGETATTLQRDILDMGYDAQTRIRSMQASANMGIWEGQNQSAALKTGAITSGLEGVARVSQGYLSYKGKS